MPDETTRRYPFVAIDRVTRWVFMHIYGDMTNESSLDFLRRLKLAWPIKIAKILSDNGTQFTDRFATKDKKPSGDHAFDRACASMAIEHRLALPRHPQTNGMVERFNGRINELLQQPDSKAGPTWKKPCATTSTYTTTPFLKAPSAPRRQPRSSRNGSDRSPSYSLNAFMTTRDLTFRTSSADSPIP
jgi:transposase InsO family protein